MMEIPSTTTEIYMSLADFNAALQRVRDQVAKPKEPKGKVESKEPKAKPIVARTAVPAAHVRVWVTKARYVRIESQYCACCHTTVTFIGGHYAAQSSGAATRRILESQLQPHEIADLQSLPQDIWQAETVSIPACPSCLGVGQSTIDQLLNLIESTSHTQMRLWS
jgi:hypothetical protein